MITFKQVNGDVIVNDGLSEAKAFTGMRIDPRPRTCVVVTMPGSKASLDVNGSNIELGPNSWLNVTAGAPRRALGFLPTGKDIRLAVGRLWAVVDGSPHYEEDFNAAVGVRG
jgi:hypothetical protein